MKEIIEWLIGIEQVAGNLYREAALLFAQDKGLSAFLRDLAEDEAWHFHVMGSAAEFLRAHPDMKSAQVALDDESRRKILAHFLENLQQLEAGLVKKEDILSCTVSTEFSEWNELFLYVVNTLKEESREFQYAAAKMQGHLDQVVVFLETRPEGPPLLERIRKLPHVWREKVLVVEDSEPLRTMLEHVLLRQYNVATAENGQKGLEKIKGNFFDVIISDIDMPIMDGITLFRKAVSYDPAIGRRFLIMSGFFSDKHRLFLETNHIPYMQKPIVLGEVKKRLADLVEKNRRSSNDAVFSKSPNPYNL
jgi:CheY-like chemotaxis protein